jgi:NAD(P)H-hydrate epimerase
MDYINPTEMRVIDKNSPYFGVDLSKLMDNAGRAIFEELEKISDMKKKTLTIIAGPGNNGGDGFVAASYLYKKGYTPKVHLVGSKEKIKTRESRRALSELEDTGVKVEVAEKFGEIEYTADIIVDALLGTGIKGEPREPYNGMIKEINGSNAFKVSIDVPSGLGTSTVVGADLVIALHMVKEGTEGFETVVRDIGIPEKAANYVGPGDLIARLSREKDSHKGNNGRVMVLAGSSDYSGAPVLTGRGALAADCDLVTLFVPDSILNAVRTYLPDFIIRSYNGDYLNPRAVERLVDFSKSQDVCVVGPGLGVADESGTALNTLLSRIKIPVVIDADGLKLVDRKVLTGLEGVITPHKTEFAKLTGEKLPDGLEGRRDVLKHWANRLSATILLKSRVDIIASPDGRAKFNETGNAGMTVGGTGDVLAGIVGGFLSQGMNDFSAACSAAFVNGSAGDALYQFKGYGYTASDVAKEIPYTIKRLFDLYE